MKNNPSLINWALLLLLGCIWGASFMGVSVALEDLGPLSVAAGRIALGAIVLICVAFASGAGLPKLSQPQGKRIWLHCFGFAIFTNALPFALLSWGQQHVTSGFAGITMAVIPLFVLPLAAVILHEKMGRARIIGFALGFAGVVVLIGADQLGGLTNATENIARIACLGASLCYALGTMITRTAPKVHLFSYSALGLTMATMMIVPIALVVDGVPTEIGQRAGAAVLYLGIFPTALATILLVRVVNTAGPTFLSLVNYQVPIWAVVNGLVFLGEALPASFVIALLMILAGLVLGQTKAVRFRA